MAHGWSSSTPGSESGASSPTRTRQSRSSPRSRRWAARPTRRRAQWPTGRRASASCPTAVDRFGRLDAVVNNAGILRDRMITSMTEDDFDAVIAVHLKGTFQMTKHACDHWRSLAKAGKAIRRADHQHHVGRRVRRQHRPGLLRRRQGRHHFPDPHDGARDGSLRGHRQRGVTRGAYADVCRSLQLRLGRTRRATTSTPSIRALSPPWSPTWLHRTRAG